MDTAVGYCEETWDLPEESKFRWTVEVAGLMEYYIERHSQPDIDRLFDWVRKGRIEIAGGYQNMPTEVVGHEELIRRFYYAQHLRKTYNIPIETLIFDDVPGWTWAE